MSSIPDMTDGDDAEGVDDDEQQQSASADRMDVRQYVGMLQDASCASKHLVIVVHLPTFTAARLRCSDHSLRLRKLISIMCRYCYVPCRSSTSTR
jgi:hypothetical protein